MLRFPRDTSGRRAEIAAAYRVKDKASGKSAVKNAMLSLYTDHGDAMTQPLVEHYRQILESEEMRQIWIPIEKRELPKVVGIPPT